MKIFLSAVSGQFRGCREALASDLRAMGAEVVVQEDFQQQGRTLLEELEGYIADCDRVIALVGDAHGFEPDPSQFPQDMPRRSYTQWEYFFARGERLDGTTRASKEIYVYFASPEYLAANVVKQSTDAANLQQAFVAAIKRSRKDQNNFESAIKLRALALRDSGGNAGGAEQIAAVDDGRRRGRLYVGVRARGKTGGEAGGSRGGAKRGEGGGHGDGQTGGEPWGTGQGWERRLGSKRPPPSSNELLCQGADWPTRRGGDDFWSPIPSIDRLLPSTSGAKPFLSPEGRKSPRCCWL